MSETEAPYRERPTRTERLPLGPLLRVLDAWVAANDTTYTHLCEVNGLDRTMLRDSRRRGWMSLKHVDRFLVATGHGPDVLRELYPVAP